MPDFESSLALYMPAGVFRAVIGMGSRRALAAERTPHMLVGPYDSVPCTLRLHASIGVCNNSCLKAFFGIAGK